MKSEKTEKNIRDIFTPWRKKEVEVEQIVEEDGESSLEEGDGAAFEDSPDYYKVIGGPNYERLDLDDIDSIEDFDVVEEAIENKESIDRTGDASVVTEVETSIIPEIEPKKASSKIAIISGVLDRIQRPIDRMRVNIEKKQREKFKAQMIAAEEKQILRQMTAEHKKAAIEEVPVEVSKEEKPVEKVAEKPLEKPKIDSEILKLRKEYMGLKKRAKIDIEKARKLKAESPQSEEYKKAVHKARRSRAAFHEFAEEKAEILGLKLENRKAKTKPLVKEKQAKDVYVKDNRVKTSSVKNRLPKIKIPREWKIEPELQEIFLRSFIYMVVSGLVTLGLIFAIKFMLKGRENVPDAAPIVSASAPADSAIFIETEGNDVSNIIEPEAVIMASGNSLMDEMSAALTPADDFPPDYLPPYYYDLWQSANLGDADAQHDLATYFAGVDIEEPDYRLAAWWYSKAAEAGIANAQYNLGSLFENGLGVEKNLELSHFWYRKAAAQNHVDAIFNLGIANYNGYGMPVNMENAAEYFREAVALGNARAAYNLGLMHRNRQFLGADPVLGRIYLERAAAAGDTRAREALEDAIRIDSRAEILSDSLIIEQGSSFEQEDAITPLSEEEASAFHDLIHIAPPE